MISGQLLTRSYFKEQTKEMSELRKKNEKIEQEKMKQATDLFISLVNEDAFEEFLTIRAYDQLD